MNEINITRNGQPDHKLMLKYKIQKIINDTLPKINEFFETQGGHYK